MNDIIMILRYQINGTSFRRHFPKTDVILCFTVFFAKKTLSLKVEVWLDKSKDFRVFLNSLALPMNLFNLVLKNVFFFFLKKYVFHFMSTFLV